MNVLIIGSGGREHAIAKKIAQSPHVNHVYCAKGNARMVEDGIELVDIAETDALALVDFAQHHDIDWTFVGPEIPLFHGVSDAFEAAGLAIFSPSKAAAKIEYSKDYAKQLMNQYHIPTANSKTFTTYEQAWEYVQAQGAPIVIKADGLAAGKGVTVALQLEEAQQALFAIFNDTTYTYADGVRVVIEEYLEGEEFSVFSFVNGTNAYFAGISQDHKRAYDGDLGPNTGGMGAYSPIPHFTNDIIEQSMRQVVQPLVEGLAAEGTPYKGVLYAGLMLTAEGIKVIEFNARFGDPETQVVLTQLKSDLALIVQDMLAGKTPNIEWHDNQVTLGVVVAAEGYPIQAKIGSELGTLQVPEHLQLFAAGVKGNVGHYQVSGGRVFLAASQATTIETAQHNVYQWLDQQHFPNTFYRHDIGHRAIK